MKKQLLKLTLLALVVFFSASTSQAQALWTTNGTYKISTSGLSPNLYLSINTSSGALEWAEELPNDDPTQVWNVLDHREPASAGYMEIWASIPDVGNFTLVADQTTFDGTGDKDITLTVRFGDPIADTSSSDYGYDQFQRRKAKVNAEGLADAAGSNPAAGNNALFVKPPGEGGSRYGVIPAAAGDPVLFDGGGIDVLQYHLVEEAVASVNTFGIDAFTVSNPISNQLIVRGATAKVQELSLYTVLGNKVLSKKVSNANGDINVDVNSLSTGLYILKMIGSNGEKFSKKVIKQ